ncbi:MAG: hypothetical protein OEY88_05135 [Candidatus Bathyarchaeota archaeon]|nr:hypothetical protein [Candidatus Bathyarchaeota archaeon]
MKEAIVKGHVEKWLKKRWRPMMPVPNGNIDFIVSVYYPRISCRWIANFEAVECKGTTSNVHRAIGQCLHYYIIYGCIPTYLAVPENYKQLKTLRRTAKFFNLPIGILLINSNGEISIERKPNGKARHFRLLKNEKGDLTNERDSDYKLHFSSVSTCRALQTSFKDSTFKHF